MLNSDGSDVILYLSAVAFQNIWNVVELVKIRDRYKTPFFVLLSFYIDIDQAIEILLCNGFSKVVGYLPHHITLWQSGNLSFGYQKIELGGKGRRLGIAVNVDRFYPSYPE